MKCFKTKFTAFLLAAGLWLPGAVRAGTNPFEQVAADAYTGRFAGPEVTICLRPEAGKWSGTIHLKGQNFTIQGENQDGKLAGTYGAGDQNWAFTATSDGDNLTFTSGTFTTKLQRQKLPKLEGIFASKNVILKFKNQDRGINGIITLNGKDFRFTATKSAGDLNGEFKAGEDSFKFTLVSDPAGLTFQTGNFTEVVTDSRAAAESGEAWAQSDIGACYECAIGVEKNLAEAAKWYRKAADQGDAQAQSHLGHCYENGIGVEKDAAEAIKWYRKAAEQGNDSAQSCIGYCYEKGIGVEKDAAEAVNWYRKAAEQGDAYAELRIGYCYLKGISVEKDAAEAVNWYRKAAEQGNDSAQSCIGYCYEKGIGVEKDAAEAVKWYRKAAEQGDADGQNHAAWILATCPNSNTRDGKKAVELATKACVAKQDFNALDTLAAAFAEGGDFEQAIASEKRALEAAKSTDANDLPAARERLALYEAHKPYHETSGTR